MRVILPGMLLFGAAVAWAQGVDLRDPALNRDPARASTCRVCGEIASIREVRREATALASTDASRGMVNNPGGDGVFGAAVYLPLDTGSNNRPRVGGIGTTEMQERFGANTYEIVVRLDSGERQVVQRSDGIRFRVGERVTVSNGMLAPL